jgi:ADP-ribose pyrophosphatase YjhB (NUDIX family)
MSWLKWARKLQSISQTGLHFTENIYDIERYTQIGDIASEIISTYSNLTKPEILKFNASEFGYATPKVDVRGVVFRDNKILLVKEIVDQGRWTLPGGWADVNETPGQSVVKEIREESGYETEAIKLLAVFDREKQGHQPPFPYHVYKMFFYCKIIGGKASKSIETSGVEFFGEQELPELSVSRVTESQIKLFFKKHQNPDSPTDFD